MCEASMFPRSMFSPAVSSHSPVSPGADVARASPSPGADVGEVGWAKPWRERRENGSLPSLPACPAKCPTGVSTPRIRRRPSLATCPALPYSPARCARPRMSGRGDHAAEQTGCRREAQRADGSPQVHESTQSRVVDGGRERAGQRGDTCLASWPDVFQVLSRSEAHPRGTCRTEVSLEYSQQPSALQHWGTLTPRCRPAKPTRLAAHLANAVTDEPVADAVRCSLGCKYGIDVGCGGSAAHRGEGRDRWSGLDPLDSLVHGRCPCISYAYRARAHPAL
jgi:hypothetical protein